MSKGRLIIVSNRLPVTVAKRGSSIKLQSSVGGLATGLDEFHSTHNSLWIGWPGYVAAKAEQEKKLVIQKLKTKKCYPVFLSAYDVENYYRGFCNNTIWPLFHYFMQHVTFENKYWQAYKRVNEQFCDVLSSIITQHDRVWIHDYQLLLLPNLIRQKFPESTIGFFLHVPFPSSEVFRLLPWRNELIDGLLGADLIGFHTHDYVRHFVESVRRTKGYEYSLGLINVGQTTIQVDAFPISINYDRFYETAQKPFVQQEIKRIRHRIGDRKIIVSIDRLDYTKGIPERLKAFDLFLEKYPAYRKKVTLILVAVPSRTNVEHYVELKKHVDEVISQINGKYGDIGYMPIWYFYRLLPFEKLIPLYKIGDVALVTPLRDGMNLIAKEYIASKPDQKGVLILGEMAGAAQELGEALIVNPNNRDELADAIHTALTMPVKEQQRRNKILQQRLKRYDIKRWAHDYMDRLHHIKRIQQTTNISRLDDRLVKKLLGEYAHSTKSLLLLDYDGTLISFKKDPEDAQPFDQIKSLLKRLSSSKGTQIVIVSGRKKATLDKWFGGIRLSLIAEHGVWLKKPDGEWKLIEPIDNTWKKKIRPILELYVDRTPGSIMEEKEYSLVWHYRRADPKLALIRSGELKDTLRHLVANLDIGILEGSKVVEIKNTGINKGKAALEWLKQGPWDFIMAIGDDWTDEDTFKVLPENAYSIKVGYGFTSARFTIENPFAVRELLKKMIKRS